MNGYHYIMSSLPYLSLDIAAPFGFDAFLSKIRGFVPEKDYERIRRILADEPVECSAVADYLKRKSSVDRLLLAKREKRLFGRNVRYFVPSDADAEMMALANKVFEDGNPLDAEMNVLRMYWACAENIGLLHCFDFTSLCVYAIKLKILSRIGSFDKKKGAEEFDRLFLSLKVSSDA